MQKTQHTSDKKYLSTHLYLMKNSDYQIFFIFLFLKVKVSKRDV